MSLEAALIDLNGTLINDEPVSFVAFKKVLGSLGMGLNLAKYKTFFAGKTSAQGMRDYLAAHHRERDFEVSVLLEQVDAEYEVIAGEIKPIEGVTGFVGAVAARGAGVAVVTSATRREADRLLGANPGVGDHVQVLITAEDVRQSKPDPEGFLLAAKQLGIYHDQAVVVGDSPADIQAARAAEMYSIAVTNTHTPWQLRAADRVVEALSPKLAAELFPDPAV